MAGRERKYTPRVRSSRPIGESRSTNKSPATPIPAPESREGGWFLPDPQAQRLHQKSALGHRVDDGILLTPEEVMFCHWYRHVPLPGGTGWFDEQVKATHDLHSQPLPSMFCATVANWLSPLSTSSTGSHISTMQHGPFVGSATKHGPGTVVSVKFGCTTPATGWTGKNCWLG